MQEQDGYLEPAHYARRPMNAFLIFCKRHRSVVRAKYPSLENRSITKILGEWWANLEKDEKSSYTSLAKQYKDAFFNANPNFKWYKLPAPPLRTLAARPREAIGKQRQSPAKEKHDAELEKTNNNSTRVDLNKKSNNESFVRGSRPLSMFTPGKLADEAQMGGLSSLLATKTETKTINPYYSPPSFKSNSISTPNNHGSHNLLDSNPKGGPNNIRDLQHELSETKRVFEEDSDEEQGRVYNRQGHNEFTNQDVINKIVDKRYSSGGGSDDERKSDRSCKGKRYQEFMAVGGLIVNKRQKREYSERMLDENYSTNNSWEPSSSRNDDPVNDDSTRSCNETENDIKIDTTEQERNTNKTFNAVDFDLDAKIKALPSLSLEKFQDKKRDNKKRKKSTGIKSKPKIVNSVPRVYKDRETADSWRETVIGSQKRKPRKVSITRLQVNSMVSTQEHKISPEIKIATEAPCTVVHSMDICKQSHTNVDLFALATLAEVASKTSKLDDSSIMETFTAKTSDGNTSKV